MNFLREYKRYLLEKTPASKQMQYFWLAAAAVLLVFVVLQFSSEQILRSFLLLVISISLITDAVTNLAYFNNKALFEKLVNAKIAANIISLTYIIVFLILSARNHG
jgi:presenilin-like A22 family membrane protease